jgi:hypothetical protein
MIPEILADLGYSEKIGSPGNDFLLSDSDTIVYGLQGDDALRTNDTSDPVGNSLLVGGRGSDRYIIDDEFQIIGIFDTGNSNGDILEASEFNFYDNDTFAYEVYNNTLVLFEIDNLTLLDGDDYDGDGLEETYFRVNDGTAVLHAYMHADGNIRYANYQSEADLEEFMTANDVSSSV